MDLFNGMAPASCRRHRHFRRSLAAPPSRAVLAALLCLAAPAGGGQAGAQTADSLRIEAYRFWRQPDLTLTELFGVVPLRALTFTPQAGMQRAAYDGALEVRDSAGLVLRREEWHGGVTLPQVTAETLDRASTSQHFAFSLKPGLYTIALEVRDSAGGATRRAQRTVRAHEARPPHSDLVLASDLVRLGEDDPVPSGALVRGSLAIVPNFTGAVPPTQAAVGLFSEVYRSAAEPETASVSVVVEGRGRSFRHETSPQIRIYPPEGGVETFGVDLTGLPPGEYTLSLAVAFPRDTLSAAHALTMLPPGAGEARLATAVPYPELSSAELDSIWGPMRYIATEDEKSAFESLTSADAKRQLIARFWERRAQGTGDDPAALRQEFEQRVAFANREFRPPSPGNRRVPGWATDRGQLWIILGPPAERYVEAERKDQRNPWEVWRYIGGRGDKFVFWDRSGFGDFVLAHSTHRDFLGIPDWERYFTGEALDFIRKF